MASPKAGHAAIIKVYDIDDVVTLTNEAMTDLTGDIFQVTDATKRILDPDTTFTADDGSGVPILSVDHLFGKITLDGSQIGSVTLTGKNIPVTVALASHSKSLTINKSRIILDDTAFGDNEFRRILGLKDATMEFKFTGEGGATENVRLWQKKLDEDDRLLMEVDFGFSGKVFRGWFQVPEWALDQPVADLVGMGFTLVSRPVVNAQDGGDVTNGLG